MRRKSSLILSVKPGNPLLTSFSRRGKQLVLINFYPRDSFCVFFAAMLSFRASAEIFGRVVQKKMFVKSGVDLSMPEVSAILMCVFLSLLPIVMGNLV